MLKINQEMLEKLEFDFEQALSEFAESKRQHAFTVDVPAPIAHPLVEAAFAAGGFQLVPRAPEEPAPPQPPPASAKVLPKAEAFQRLAKLEGKSVGAQLDGMRRLLMDMFESFLG